MGGAEACQSRGRCSRVGRRAKLQLGGRDPAFLPCPGEPRVHARGGLRRRGAAILPLLPVGVCFVELSAGKPPLLLCLPTSLSGCGDGNLPRQSRVSLWNTEQPRGCVPGAPQLHHRPPPSQQAGRGVSPGLGDPRRRRLRECAANLAPQPPLAKVPLPKAWARGAQLGAPSLLGGVG